MSRESPKLGTDRAVGLVYRQVTLTVAAFDRLKQLQRALEASTGHKWTNGEVLDHLLLALA